MREWLKDFITVVEDCALALPESYERGQLLLAVEDARKHVHDEETMAETVTIRFLDEPRDPDHA